jgi:hypothetical protein
LLGDEFLDFNHLPLRGSHDQLFHFCDPKTQCVAVLIETDAG